MGNDNHRLISDLSEAYADSMADGDSDRMYYRGSLAAAYIIGAEETLHRVCNVIRESAVVGGISAQQARTLLCIIDKIESMPNEHNNKPDKTLPATQDA